MGYNVYLHLTMKIVALIACVVAVCLNVAATTNTRTPRADLIPNSFIYAVSTYIFILLLFLAWTTFFKGDIDKKFFAIVLICGFLWNVGGGIGVIIYHAVCSYAIDTPQLIGGILAVAAGCVMLADGMHNLEFF